MARQQLHSLSGPHPFAIGAGAPMPDNAPWLGGWLRILTGPIAENADLEVTHGLRCTPRFAWLLDAGVSGIAGPLPRGTTAWNAAAVYFSTPSIPDGSALTVLIC